jgi:hypothetical protein
VSNPVNIHSPNQYLAMEREFSRDWKVRRDSTEDPAIAARIENNHERVLAAHHYNELPADVALHVRFRSSDFGYNWNGQLEELLRGR